MNTILIFIIIFAILVGFFMMINCSQESFYIEPGTIMDGDTMTTSIDGSTFNPPLELEGPGNPAWTGY